MSSLAADPRVASLVDKIARRHCGVGVDLNELVGAGMLAACQAAERFDPSKGSLTGFLRPRVRGAIIDAARKDCSPIRTPSGCPPKRTVGDSQRDGQGDGQGDGQVTLADLVSDYRGDHQPDVWAMVSALPTEQAEIIRVRYGLDGPSLSQEAAALALGRTSDDVSNIEASALAVLRQRLANLDYPRPAFDEERTMNRNGFHAAEPSTAATAEPTDGKRCPACDRRYKNLNVNRCYYRDCPASGYAATSAAPKGKAKASKTKPAVVGQPVPVDAAVSAAGPNGSLADELHVMALLVAMMPAARLRLLSWAQSAFNA